MARRRRVASGVAAGLALMVLGVLLFKAGLDDADKWASVIGVFVALLGLGVSGYGVVLARRALQPSPQPTSGQVEASGVRSIAAHNISGSVSTGNVVSSASTDEDRNLMAKAPEPDPAFVADSHQKSAKPASASAQVQVTASGERSIAAQIISGTASTGDTPPSKR